CLFFLQAEDGIRDALVTGVQTCALPICEHFNGARVLITGGAGFIGSHLAEALVSLGASVVVIDDLSGGDRENLASFGPVEFIEEIGRASCREKCRCGGDAKVKKSKRSQR